MEKEPTNAERLPGEYLATYTRAMDALKAITDAIHDMPAPGSEGVTWGSVADMYHTAKELEAVTRPPR